jgi:hypothetical protein
MQAQVLSPSGAIRGMVAMIRVRVKNRSRLASTALAALLTLFLVGDRAAYTAAIPGIDPLDVLDLAVKNNVLVIVDTSGSMTGTAKKVTPAHDVGGDDPAGRFYQAKRALREVMKGSAGTANFGLATFHPNFEERRMRASSTTGEGPLHYVSQDADAAAWLGYFDAVNMTLLNYDGWTSAEMFASFDTGSASGHGYNAAYPAATCTNNTPGGDHIMNTHCRYYVRSLLLRDNLQFTWNPSPTPNTAANRIAGLIAGSIRTPSTNPSFTCPNPPKGLLGDDVDAFNDGTEKRACFQIVNSKTGATATYYLTSTSFSFVDKDGSGSGDECKQTGINLDVAPCTDDSVAQKIQNQMRLELQIDPNTGQPIDVPFAQFPTAATTTLNGLSPHDTPPTFTNTGIRSAGGTPIAASLRFAKDYFQNTVFPARPAAVVGKQKNFVIVLTDGAESCESVSDAVTAAQALYGLTPSNDNRVETLVIVFAESVSSANQIARGGSGNLRDAFTALSLEDLIQALKDAISLASTSGSFSAQSSITESIYELGPVLTPAPGVDPRDPKTRYTANVPVLFRSTFEMPGFKGHVKAFRNASGTSLEVWDAGQKLLDRVKNGMEVGPTPAACPSKTVNSVSYKACTFAELLNGATEATVGTASRIKRRIYTTTGNNLAPVTATGLIGRTANVTAGTTAYRVPLWPPTTATSGGVAPNDANSSPGLLDGALGLLSLSETELETKFQACVGASANLPANCGSAAKRLDEQRREAREMMLAFLAGAQTIPDANGEPARDGTAKRLLFKARPWILAESTLSAAAVVTPPLQAKPTIHPDEYKLFRDGPRSSSNVAVNGILEGFGLRNPDDDGQAASKSSTTLKPSMAVVYHGANDGLHAFRGAPCSYATLACAGETGGEELWAFVPFDQLGKLAGLMKTQRRADKTYVIASPVRFADVFIPVVPVPGTFTVTISGANVKGAGVWRTFLYVGRGIGGKYYTALDVTVPGPFTRHSLTGDVTNGGEKYAPLPVWSRGNPDTSDGKPYSGTNVYNNPNGTGGPADYIAYLRMGQTWSVPAIASVTGSENTTPRAPAPAGVEFVAYVGSGYGAPGEGTTFYALDALTGDVIAWTDVDAPPTTAPATPIFTPNALVASPAVFSPNMLKADFIGNPAGEKATRVYIGDVYGRLWKFLPSTAKTGFPAILMQDLGVQQTIGVAVALLNLDYDGTAKPYIFLETGRDNRVSPPPAATPPFKIIGLRDDASDIDFTTPQTPFELFPRSDPGVPGIDFPGPPDPVNFRFRGTTQPATAFNAEKKGRVFFAGTQFNPIDANCISSFDSILFAVTAGTGQAAYDTGTGTAYTTFIGDKITGVSVTGGNLVVDQGIVAGGAPPPPAPPTTLPPEPGTEGDVFLGSKLAGTTAYRVGSVVCQP